ncbi:hypothetical protein EYC80_003500 [Monilinia laxa]|uniref:Uncharacterized protein n=1 Tax=Monilinia laxa TaxID=61186 RepID=A0A5N6KE54_MONLA|nr:hypothetical protein EYC80_003500 [Monilinia laxa]
MGKKIWDDIFTKEREGCTFGLRALAWAFSFSTSCIAGRTWGGARVFVSFVHTGDGEGGMDGWMDDDDERCGTGEFSFVDVVGLKKISKMQNLKKEHGWMAASEQYRQRQRVRMKKTRL